MNNGWVKLHRSLIKWEWFTDPKTSHFMIYCLAKASHKDMRYRGRVIPKGGFWFGRKKATIETGLSEQSIRTAINHLKSTSEITIKPSAQGSVIIVNNWDKYQHATSELTNNQPTSNQQVTTYKNVKNVKKIKSGSFSVNLVSLFDDDEIITWLKSTGTEKIQDTLYSKYDTSFLKEEIENAYYWQAENSKRKAGTYLKGWCDRSNNNNKTKKLTEAELDKAFADM